MIRSRLGITLLCGSLLAAAGPTAAAPEQYTIDTRGMHAFV
ncbi:hypothetical protein [Halomonas denitrificans]